MERNMSGNSLCHLKSKYQNGSYKYAEKLSVITWGEYWLPLTMCLSSFMTVTIISLVTDITIVSVFWHTTVPSIIFAQWPVVIAITKTITNVCVPT